MINYCKAFQFPLSFSSWLRVKSVAPITLPTKHRKCLFTALPKDQSPVQSWAKYTPVYACQLWKCLCLKGPRRKAN